MAGLSDKVSISFRGVILWVIPCSLLVLFLANSAEAQNGIAIAGVEAFWEDSLAIIHPKIESPLSTVHVRTLQTGVPIRFDFQIQLFRTGFSKTIHQEVTVEYNVWTDRYRVLAPIGALAIKSLATVDKLFRNDLILILHPADIPRNEEWFVRVQVEAYPVNVAEDGTKQVGSLERELQGLTGWLFRRGRSRTEKSKWSTTAKLPERSPAGSQP
ncbi:MAG: hypothetical protein V2A56_12745 [bacterium]